LRFFIGKRSNHNNTVISHVTVVKSSEDNYCPLRRRTKRILCVVDGDLNRVACINLRQEADFYVGIRKSLRHKVAPDRSNVDYIQEEPALANSERKAPIQGKVGSIV
jgi:hypothetical protein